jgi:hypothetical protein
MSHSLLEWGVPTKKLFCMFVPKSVRAISFSAHDFPCVGSQKPQSTAGPQARIALGMSTEVAAWGAVVVDCNGEDGGQVHCLTVKVVGVLHFVSSEKSRGVYEW